MIEKVRKYMKSNLYESSHDIEHSFRVVNNAMLISREKQDVDIELLEIACLLHDIAKVQEDKDETRHTDHCVLGADMARDFLLSIGYPKSKVSKVWEAIRYHRDFLPSRDLCIEAQILFDAGILENLGAIGIARTYMMAGEFQERLFNPEPLSEYVRHNVIMPTKKVIDYSLHAPNLEFELHWNDADQLLYTEEAKRIARERIAYTRAFFLKLREEVVHDD